MALKIIIPKPASKLSWPSRLLRVGLLALAAVLLLFLSVAGYYYWKYQSVVDQRLKQPLFANTAKIFAAPR